MVSASGESTPSASASASAPASDLTSQEETKSSSIGSVQNPSVQKNSRLKYLHIFGSLNSIPPWAQLVLGSAILLAIPLYRMVLKSRDLKKAVEATVEMVETVVEAADKVAEAADKVTEVAEKALGEVVQALPGGSLKEAAVKLEEVAVFVNKEVEIVDSFIDEVDALVNGLEIKLKTIKNGNELIKISAEEKGAR